MATIGFLCVDGRPDIAQVQEGSGQSFVAGDPLIMSSGQVIIATSSATIWGIALDKASGTQTTVLQAIPITPNQRWVAQLSGTTAVSYIGNGYDLTIVTGANYVNTSGTTDKTFIIEALDPRDAVGTTYGRVVGRFNVLRSTEVYL